MIANINPSHACFEESHNTLKYANRAKNIKIRPKMQIMTAEMTYLQRADKLEEENTMLRQALADARNKRKSLDGDMINKLMLESPPEAKRVKCFHSDEKVQMLEVRIICVAVPIHD
jgi:hypothetical protein